jgi:hypothetical protein
MSNDSFNLDAPPGFRGLHPDIPVTMKTTFALLLLLLLATPVSLHAQVVNPGSDEQ